MRYPDDFNTPAFPAGKSIAVSRFMGIGSFVLLLVILFCCAFIYWAGQSKKISPYIISINNLNGDWEVIKNSRNNEVEFSPERSMQEAVLGNFAKNWFYVSSSDYQNQELWKACDRQTFCIEQNQNISVADTCQIFCNSSEEVYNSFSYTVAPFYKTLSVNGQTMKLDERSLLITPVNSDDNLNSNWYITANINTNFEGIIKVIIFATLSKDLLNYPNTMGYYVSAFNAYRVNK